MHQPDFADFRAVLDGLAQVYGKPKPDDVLTQSYFRALSNLPLDVIRRQAQQHERYGKFFPKPFELRPKDDKPTAAAGTDEKFMVAQRDNARYWLARLKEDGEEKCLKEGLGARAIEQLWDWDRRIQRGEAKG